MTGDGVIRVKSHVGRDLLDSAAAFKTEAAAVWEYVVNSLQYVDVGVKPTVEVVVRTRKKVIEIRDNGCGMTATDLEHSTPRSNAQRAMERLLGLRVLPIVNENDTVATQEIRFGDNDRLAALVSELVHADLLVLLSDVDALYTRPPHEPGAARIERVEHDDDLADVELGDIGAAGVGTGGAGTKIAAARHAVAHGIPVVLTSTGNVGAALLGEPVGTWFEAAPRD